MDETIDEEGPTNRPTHNQALMSKIEQIEVDSDDDISSGANESSDDEKDKATKILEKAKSKGLKKLQAPGAQAMTKLQSAPIQTHNGWAAFGSAEPNNKANQGDEKSNISQSNGWGDFQDSNPLSAESKKSPSTPEEAPHSPKVNLEKVLKTSENLPSKLEEIHQSKENPMLWDETTTDMRKYVDDPPQIDNQENIETSEGQEEEIDSPQKPREEQKQIVGHQASPTRVKERSSNNSVYVRKSIDQRLLESRYSNPFE